MPSDRDIVRPPVSSSRFIDLLELGQSTAEILGCRNSTGLPWAPIFGLPSPRTRAPCAFSLSRAAQDVFNLVAEVMDPAVGILLDELCDRRRLAQRLHELDLGVRQVRRTRRDDAVLRLSGCGSVTTAPRRLYTAVAAARSTRRSPRGSRRPIIFVPGLDKNRTAASVLSPFLRSRQPAPCKWASCPRRRPRPRAPRATEAFVSRISGSRRRSFGMLRKVPSTAGRARSSSMARPSASSTGTPSSAIWGSATSSPLARRSPAPR